MTVTEPIVRAAATGVYVAAAPLDLAGGLPHHPVDLRTARPLPAWCRAEYLAARAVLRWLLGEVAGAGAAAAELAARRSGQLYLAGHPGLAVSLSHTDGWVAAAVHLSPGGVGVDVQAPVPVTDALLRRCCTPSARARLARWSPARRARELAWIWSVQEACVKALGTGLAGRPWAIPVAVGQRTGRWRHLRWVALRGAYPLPVSCCYEPGTEGSP
jgi:4'-phosphopantetheinyl transferase